MDLTFAKSTYTLSLTHAEFLLVSKALRGTLTDDERLPATELQILMVRQRHAILAGMLHESQKAIDNIDAIANLPSLSDIVGSKKSPVPKTEDQ